MNRAGEGEAASGKHRVRARVRGKHREAEHKLSSGHDSEKNNKDRKQAARGHKGKTLAFSGDFSEEVPSTVS